ncbi:hypothetical protein BCR44DRAFT_1277323 [Catenaria anguillulae PL171]|uniref:Uncharacterized protein n=1 Tax=Catenaria anguillulae PL171 TaxID=765915 RepID=A0A1Y2H9E7_9FUNG|nr:hypothetical protein BCR44DRAFT_1277323 [Catenaria anguillulae PL171]
MAYSVCHFNVIRAAIPILALSFSLIHRLPGLVLDQGIGALIPLSPEIEISNALQVFLVADIPRAALDSSQVRTPDSDYCCWAVVITFSSISTKRPISSRPALFVNRRRTSTNGKARRQPGHSQLESASPGSSCLAVILASQLTISSARIITPLVRVMPSPRHVPAIQVHCLVCFQAAVSICGAHFEPDKQQYQSWSCPRRVRDVHRHYLRLCPTTSARVVPVPQLVRHARILSPFPQCGPRRRIHAADA